MRDESTLGGYQDRHERPPAFEGSDGQAYSVSVLVSDEEEAEGFGGALMFIRWSPEGSEPVGHVETKYLCYGSTPEQAEARVCDLSLADVKRWLDSSIAAAVDQNY